MIDLFTEELILEAIRELTAEYARLSAKLTKLEGGN